MIETEVRLQSLGERKGGEDLEEGVQTLPWRSLTGKGAKGGGGRRKGKLDRLQIQKPLKAISVKFKNQTTMN